MKHIIWQSFLASLAGGLLSLDRTAALQIMVSRPIVAGPLIGYILADAKTGLLIGGILELLFIGGLPLGSYIPPHEIMLTALITAISIIGQKALNGRGPDIFRIYDANMLFVQGFAILLIIPMDAVCKKADIIARGLNMRLFNDALSGVDKGLISVGISNLKGLVVFFILNFSTLFVLILAGVLLIYSLLPILPTVVIMSLPWAFGAACVLSLSSAYSALYNNRSLPVFLATTFFVVAAVAVIIR